MLTLQQREAKRAKKKHRQKSTDWLYRFNLIAGVLTIVSAIYLMGVFRDVIMEVKWLLVSAVIYSLVVLLFFSKRNYYIMYFWFLGAGGFIFMNDVFADKATFTVKRPIEYKYYCYRKSGPFAEITYKRIGLNVHCADNESLGNAQYAVLTISKGFWGFEIVRERELVSE